MSELKQGTEKCTFPPGAWTASFVGLSSNPTPNLPPNWQSMATIPAPPDGMLDDECARLYADIELRASRRAEILAQAGTEFEVVRSVMLIVGDAYMPPRPATMRLINMLLSNIRGPIFWHKEKFNRGRPYHCCHQDLDPMFEWGSSRHPGHPSYPSGHSTQAHALAYLYAHMFPQKTVDLESAAARVAENREIAGLHYPSDSRAGKDLAAQLVNLLLRNSAFTAQIGRARQEWP